MEHAQATFISSTFWTERIGPTAALKTLEVMEREKSWETITDIGMNVRDIWSKIASENGINISISGLSALSTFVIKSQHAQVYKTYITQEMLKKGFLANTTFYASTCHSSELINLYADALNDVFLSISLCEKGEQDIHTLLHAGVAIGSFKRLN